MRRIRRSATRTARASYTDCRRDGADLGADDLRDALSRDVRLIGDCAQDGQSLRGDVDAAVTKQVN
jgi:hypothetical protein